MVEEPRQLTERVSCCSLQVTYRVFRVRTYLTIANPSLHGTGKYVVPALP